jgi:small subunit ribosomal protein S4
MARYREPVCRLCRREGTKLFLKGERCFGDKCSVDRRNYPPGQHGSGRQQKMKEYGRQLREKQKARRTYGVLESQFHRYYEKAAQMSGVTGENLLALLECRLDNVVYRLGFASSRASARQLVRHKHISVNGRTVNIPSFQMKPGDAIALRERSKKLSMVELVHESLRRLGRSREMSWLSVDKAQLTGQMVDMPSRDDIQIPLEERLIVELYSK